MNVLDTIFEAKAKGLRIGFTCSTFDLCHSGHILAIADAKKECDFLVVGLQCDPSVDRPEKNKPIQNMFERWVQVSGLKYVDAVVPYDTEADLTNLLNTIMPDVRVLGVEYKGKKFTGSEIDSIQIVHNRRDHSYSSSGLRRRVAEGELNTQLENK